MNDKKEDFFGREEHVVWDGQHRYTIIRETLSILDAPSDPELLKRAQDLWSEDGDPFEEKAKFANDIFEVFGPHLSIRDIRCWLDALADQYEQHWEWRNKWARDEGKKHEAIELTDAKPFEEVNGHTT